LTLPFDIELFYSFVVLDKNLPTTGNSQSEFDAVLRRNDTWYWKQSQGICSLPAHLHSSANRMNRTCLCLPSRSWYSFTDPWGMEGWVGLGWLVGYIPK